MKLLCDQMLGTLAKWLRIYGFDTFFISNEIDDSELLNIARKENRILITRDKQLIINARRENIKHIEIKTTDIDEQIKKVIKDVKFDKRNVLSRCVICNSKVLVIERKDVKGRVPERIFKSNENFWFCKNCNKIYWKGTHYENMFDKIKRLS